MKHLLKILRFLRITDEQDVLSLTNMAVMAAIYKLITADAASYVEIGTVVASLTNYGHKRLINKKDK